MLSTIYGYREMKQGVIATISSVGGFIAPKNYAIYSASKHAIEGYMKSVKKDMNKNIKIMVFRPFRLNTNLNKYATVKSPSKHRLDPRLYAEYVVARINGQKLKAFFYNTRNILLWIIKLIF